MSLKQKTISGFIWSFTDNISKSGITFVFGIIMARLLNPSEYGLVGIVTGIIMIIQPFVESGYGFTLVRKQNCTVNDFNTVFYFNIIISLLLYVLLFFTAGPLSNYFQQPALFLLIRVLGINLIVNAISLIHGVILIKNVDFKLQTKISLISTITSGLIAISLAYFGWGVWSLVWKILMGSLINTLLLWLWNKWRPVWVFSFQSLREMFGFGSRILASSLLDTAYNNVYYLIIGKFFSVSQLGYYTRANQFAYLPSTNFAIVAQRVSFPVLTTLQDDVQKLKTAFQRLIKSQTFITFTIMMGMAAVAKPMVYVIIGPKWLPCVIYLQLLCIAYMFSPLHALNLNVFNVLGRSDLYLRLEVFKKMLSIPTIIIGIIFGIKIMIAGIIFNSILAYFINSHFVGKLIGYTTLQQVKDIMPNLILSIAIGVLIFLIGFFTHFSYGVKLIVEIIIGIILTVSISEWLHIESYKEIKTIILEKFFRRK
jgi:teichuronic acid exporter